MNVLFTEGGDLLLAVGDAHAHEELVLDDSLAHLLNSLLIRIELIYHVHLLYFVCFLVVRLPSDNQDAVVVGGKVDSDYVAAEGELLLGRQLNEVPLVPHNGVALDRVQALGLPRRRLQHQVLVHASEHVDRLVLECATTEVEPSLLHL